MMILMMIYDDDDDDDYDYADGDDDVYSKLKIYYIGMESDFFNCLRIDDPLTPLSKKKDLKKKMTKEERKRNKRNGK